MNTRLSVLPQFPFLNSELLDTGRSCKLTLKIDNLDDFITANVEVKGEPVQLSGFQWCLTAEPEDSGVAVMIYCDSDAELSHCKANYAIRLKSTKKADRVAESRNIFDNESCGWGFTQIASLSVCLSS